MRPFATCRIVCSFRFVPRSLPNDSLAAATDITTHEHMATDQKHVPRVNVPMLSDLEGLDRVLDPKGVEQ